MAAPRASEASRWLLPKPLKPRGSCSQSHWGLGLRHSCLEAAVKMLEGAVKEPVEETSKLFEAAQLKATLLDAPS